MQNTMITASTVCRSLQAASKGKEFSDGGEYRGLARRFFAQLCRLCNITPPKDPTVAIKKYGLNSIKETVFEALLQTSPDELRDENGCDVTVEVVDDNNTVTPLTFKLKEHQGLLTVTATEIDGLTLTEASPQTANGVTLTALKQAILQKYINHERGHRDTADLTSFDLTDLDLSQINFGNTIISQAQLKCICASGGNVTGATIKDAINTDGLVFDRVIMDKDVAVQMISHGANSSTMLRCYIESQRLAGRKNIDLSGFDLPNIDLQGLNLHRTNLDDHVADVTMCAKLNRAALDPAAKARVTKTLALDAIRSGQDFDTCFEDYVTIAKNLGIQTIDISGFDLGDIDFEEFADLGLESTNFIFDKEGALALIDSGEVPGVMLTQYMKFATLSGADVIDIGGFDFNAFSLSGMDLSRTNLADHLDRYLSKPASCSNLLGAKLPPDVRVRIEKTAAVYLFERGVADAREVLTKYIADAKKLGMAIVDISGFDLNTIDLTAVNLCGTNLIDHLDNYLSDSAGYKNLLHAKLDADVATRINKQVALDAIRKGGNVRQCFEQYLESARMLGIQNIDISGFDIKTLLAFSNLDLRDTNIHAILEAGNVIREYH